MLLLLLMMMMIIRTINESFLLVVSDIEESPIEPLRSCTQGRLYSTMGPRARQCTGAHMNMLVGPYPCWAPGQGIALGLL